MALAAADIKTYLTQGNVSGSDGSDPQPDPDDSLGGYRSSTLFVSNAEENLYDIFSLAEATAGGTYYRCVMVRNTHASEDLLNARLVIAELPSSSDLTVQVGTEYLNDGTSPAAVAASETIAPGGVVFVAASGKADYDNGYGINGGADADLDHIENVAVWIKLTIAADCERVNSVLGNGTLKFRIDGAN